MSCFAELLEFSKIFAPTKMASFGIMFKNFKIVLRRSQNKLTHYPEHVKINRIKSWLTMVNRGLYLRLSLETSFLIFHQNEKNHLFRKSFQKNSIFSSQPIRRPNLISFIENQYKACSMEHWVLLSKRCQLICIAQYLLMDRQIQTQKGSFQTFPPENKNKNSYQTLNWS